MFTLKEVDTKAFSNYSRSPLVIQQSGMPDSPASLRKIVKILVFSKSVSLKQIKTLESYSEVFGVVRDHPEALGIVRKQLAAG